MNVTSEQLNRYTSGMATSGIQPTTADVDSVCGICSISQADAIILLKKWPNWSDAVTHYFDDPAAALREDVSSRQWEPQDNLPPYADDGMTRPSSPANFIDLSDDHAKATALQDEDEALKKALSESMKDVPHMTQESGTISSGQKFGPARSIDYPAAQWSLAPIASSREVIDHPPPSKRRRVPGHPAFLRGSLETGYNAPLLTIYHSIPLAREALLFPPLTIARYGHSDEWWAGTTDENSKAVSFHDTAAQDEDRKRFAAEIQCLMAFLDNTTRAYGSVDALSEMRYYHHTMGDTSTSKLFEAWRRACVEEQPDEPLSQVFTSVATRAPEQPDALPEEKDMLQIEGTPRGALTQIDFLDKIIWLDTWDTPPEDVWIERFGHILTLRVHNNEKSSSGLGLLPDDVWYLDRYMSEMREEVMQMRRTRHAILLNIERLNRMKLRLTEIPALQNSSPRIDVKASLEAAKNLIPIALDKTSLLEDDTVDAISDIAPTQVQTHLAVLLSNIDKSIQRYDQKKAELEQQVDSVMSDLKRPEHSTLPLRYKYTLHGVSTKPNVTYLRKFNQDLIDLQDGDGEAPDMWQWWRAAWCETPDHTKASSESQLDQPNGVPQHGDNDDIDNNVPFSITRVSRQEVLDAVRTEHNTAVLVYADETALSFRPSPLPASLKSFVETDNKSFESEMSTLHAQKAGRQRGRSNESTTTIMDDNPFDDGVYAYPRDPTPMSTSTIRSLSGQPSPKRPRSSDSMQNMNLMDDSPSYDVTPTSEIEEMSEKKGSKIGFYAEQFLQNVEMNESKR